jgi:uncharacterized membrane protein YkoI
MNKKVKKFVIPALAATIMTGGAFASASAYASVKDKPVKQEVQNEQQESAKLAKLAKITEAESKAIALKQVPGTVTDVELEDEDGTAVYGVEVQAKDGSKQDVKVNAQTGKIVKVDNGDEGENGQEANDKEVNDDQDQVTLAKQAKITEAESKTIALKQVPGTVTDVELEDEDGTVVYGVEVQAKDGSKQDVKVNAQTGKIVKVDNGDENGKGQEQNDNDAEVND